MTGDFRLAQTFLGSKSHADSRTADLVAALRQTVGALFWSMEANFKTWSASHESQPVPLLQSGPRGHHRAASRESQAASSDVLFRRGRAGARAPDDTFGPDTCRPEANCGSVAEDDFQLQRRIVGPDGLRICRVVSQVGNEPRPHPPGIGATLPGQNLHISGREP